jgi:hypothetical protein
MGTKVYSSKFDFIFDTSKTGIQYLDYTYARSLIRIFMNDDSLVLIIRGRKCTPSFSFTVNRKNKCRKRSDRSRCCL